MKSDNLCVIERVLDGLFKGLGCQIAQNILTFAKFCLQNKISSETHM